MATTLVVAAVHDGAAALFLLGWSGVRGGLRAIAGLVASREAGAVIACSCWADRSSWGLCRLHDLCGTVLRAGADRHLSGDRRRPRGQDAPAAAHRRRMAGGRGHHARSGAHSVRRELVRHQRPHAGGTRRGRVHRCRGGSRPDDPLRSATAEPAGVRTGDGRARPSTCAAATVGTPATDALVRPRGRWRILGGMARIQG